jgi:hypothetical protein
MVLDWRYVPGRGVKHPQPLVRAYCEGCERYSRAVRAPTEAEKAKARERYGSGILYPNPPRGWEQGCPRCER